MEKLVVQQSWINDSSSSATTSPKRKAITQTPDWR